MTATSRIRHGCLLVLALGLALVCGRPASAAVPSLMNYQGYLTDNTNAPANGAYTMKFALYSDSLAGSLLWTETYASVSVTAGVFNVVLGTSVPLPPTVFSGATLWLQSTVNGSDILPRRAVVSVAYAFRAGAVDPTTGTIAGQVQSTCGPSPDGMLIYIPGRSFVVYAATGGTFQFDHVPPGTYTVRFNGGTYDATNVTVTAGGTTNLGIVTVGPNLQTDISNCGSCNHACGNANATPSCTAGNCQLTCNPGFFDCNGANADGCEKNVTNDTQNCGGCGIACSFPNSTASCSASTCQISSCNAGFANCDGMNGTGCEVNINTDPNNCSSCGNTCSSNHINVRTCTGGSCTGSCSAGFADCNSNKRIDGCEVNISNDPNNCGNCGHVCPGTQVCVSGTCQ